MTATSVHGGLVRAYVPLAADGPIEAHTARDCTFNNLNHLADEAGQVYVDWAGTVGGTLAYMTTADAIVADEWQEIVTYERLVIPVRADTGQPYAMRVRIGGHASAAFDVDFRLAISPGTPSADTADDSAYLTGATASTTAAWLSGTSQGAEAWTNLVRLSASQMGAPQPYLTLTGIGGSVITGEQYRVGLTVWGRTVNVSATPRLSGLYVAAFIGD